MGGPKGAAPTKYHSIRLVDPIYFLWSASKDIYNSSRAKYSKFNLSQSDFAEHLVKFHTETGCSLCCGDAYVSKYRNVGVQTDKEEHKCTCMDQHWREDICETSHPTQEKPLHLDHASFTMYPERLKNHRKPLTEQQLSLQKLHDSRPGDNKGDNKNDLGDDNDDFDDTETLTASEGGSEDETEVFAVSNTDFGFVEGNTRPSLNANCVKYLERQIQKQRDSVEGIISKIKRKIMGGEEEVVTMATETEKTNLQQSKNGIGFRGNIERAGEENDDYITALYSMAAGHDVRYPEVTMATDQIKKEERCDDTSGRLACLEGLCLLPPQQRDCVGMMELASGDKLYPKVEEEIEEKQWATEETEVFPRTNDIPKIDTGQEIKSQELPEENIQRLAAESNLDKKAVQPIKITHKKKHYLHHHLDTKLAKLPRLYECKMCFRHFQKSAKMISHYAEEHPDQVAHGGPRRDATDAGTTSNSFPVLDLNQIAIELRQCKQCKEYVDDIKAHHRIHLVKRFTCETCGKGFFFQSTLRKHRMYHNSQQQSLTLYKCDICDKAFTDKQSLDENKFSTDNRGEMCLLCKQCSKQLVRQGSLAVHRGTQRMEKPPRCLKCGRGFTQKYNVKRHRRTCISRSHRNNACTKDFRHIKVGLKQGLKSQEVYLKSANDEPTSCQKTVQNV